jgi:hypothetical protein
MPKVRNQLFSSGVRKIQQQQKCTWALCGWVYARTVRVASSRRIVCSSGATTAASTLCTLGSSSIDVALFDANLVASTFTIFRSVSSGWFVLSGRGWKLLQPLVRARFAVIPGRWFARFRHVGAVRKKLLDFYRCCHIVYTPLYLPL